MSKSEQMLAALQEQDLALADRYFEQALTTDSEEELLDLADYLESIGFFPQAKRIFEKLAPDYPASYISLAAIASDDGDLEQAFAYLEEIQPDSDWYVAALLAKADLYQLEGLPDVAREKLAQAAIRQAREEGFSHIVLFGNPAYYPKYGFVTASDYGIYLDGQDKEEILDFVMALDLQRDGSVTRENGPWLYRDPEGYEVDEAELEVFDRKFPPKKKEKLPGQLG